MESRQVLTCTCSGLGAVLHVLHFFIAVILVSMVDWARMCVRVQMPIFTLQRSEEYYGRPLEFIPERWIEGTPEEAAFNKKVPGSWMAFGEGTRVCVGQRFALQEAKITLARLFQRCICQTIFGMACATGLPFPESAD